MSKLTELARGGLLERMSVLNIMGPTRCVSYWAHLCYNLYRTVFINCFSCNEYNGVFILSTPTPKCANKCLAILSIREILVMSHLLIV